MHLERPLRRLKTSQTKSWHRKRLLCTVFLRHHHLRWRKHAFHASHTSKYWLCHFPLRKVLLTLCILFRTQIPVDEVRSFCIDPKLLRCVIAAWLYRKTREKCSQIPSPLRQCKRLFLNILAVSQFLGGHCPHACQRWLCLMNCEF